MTPSLPTPKTLYVHDNVSSFVRERFGEKSPEYDIAQRFIKYIDSQPHVRIGTLEEELGGLIAQVNPKLFDIAFGFGYKGEEIAQLLHGRWSAFPNLTRLDITRQEKEDGSGHVLVSKSDTPLEEQIAQAGEFKSCALVDDVLYTGFTMRSVMDLLPLGSIDECHLFFTRGLEETKKEFEKQGCKVHIGVELPGKIEVDASTISTMNLITEGAIRTNNGDLTYCDRPSWLEAWFPNDTDIIMHLCQSLMHLLKSVSIEERKVKPHVIAQATSTTV